MADRIIVVDGVQHHFPADATDAEISDALNGPPAQGWASSLRSIFSPAGMSGLKTYGNELISGDGTARSQVADFGKKEASGFASTLNPVNQVKGIYRLVTTNPIDTAKGIYQTGKSALEGDPTAIGSVLASVVAPKADAAALRGINRLSTAVAESPKAQAGLGYVSGAGTAMLTGVGHPFIGAAIGRMAAPVIGDIASGVAKGSGAILDKLGIRETPTSTFFPPAPPDPLMAAVDRYAPNTSGFDPREPRVMPDSPNLPAGIPQGVYAQLSDGTWGVKALPGHKLISGEPVNVANQAGQMAVKMVGKIGPDGIASIGERAPLPTEPIAFHGDKIMDPKLREMILQHLKEQD